MRRESDLTRNAVSLIVNGGTLAVEHSAAFKAADEYLAQRFRQSMTTMSAVDKWKL